MTNYLCFFDEADEQSGKNKKFFVTGALLFDITKALAVTNDIEGIRAQNGYSSNHSLKFSISDKPESVTREQFKAAKSSVLKMLRKYGCVFIAQCVHHKICEPNSKETAEDSGETIAFKWSAEGILTKVQQFLDSQDEPSSAFVIFDRRNKQYDFIKSLFQNRLSQNNEGFKLTGVIGIASSNDGSSHLSSACDIAVGAFRHVVNEPDKDVAGTDLMKSLRHIMWGVSDNSNQTKKIVTEYGLLLRPLEVRNREYKADYDRLKTRIHLWANKD